ncbi:hypothetical protein K456DRAFT_44185 [Colletotrichum gloeosporioides 23]|nr:hypothetical protein K456DRAFT_44185 [Colletotrichum gloeosporioides 23]
MAFTTDKTGWQALCNRTPAAYASFIYGVLTTRIFCRPTCPARLARRANVVFFDAADDAVRAGFRPCKRCKPDSATPEKRNQDVVQRACGIIRERYGAVTPAETAKLVGLSYRYFHGVFKEVTGVTPAHFARQCREEQVRDAVGSANCNTPPAATSMNTTAMPKTSDELCTNDNLNPAERGYKESSSETPELEKELDLIWQEMCQDDGYALWDQVDETLNGEVPWNEWLSATCQVNDVGIQDSEWII